jgi:hypothetical protein
MNSLTSSLSADIAEQIKTLADDGCRIGTIHNYTNTDGEVSNQQVLIGFNYGNMLESDLATLQKYRPATSSVEIVAHAELIASIQSSIAAYKAGTANPNYTNAETYENLGHGVKKHKESGFYHFDAIVIKKEIVKPSEKEKKDVKSSDKTLAKKRLEKMLKRSKFRQFKISPDAFAGIVFNKWKMELV